MTVKPDVQDVGVRTISQELRPSSLLPVSASERDEPPNPPPGEIGHREDVSGGKDGKGWRGYTEIVQVVEEQLHPDPDIKPLDTCTAGAAPAEHICHLGQAREVGVEVSGGASVGVEELSATLGVSVNAQVSAQRECEATIKAGNKYVSLPTVTMYKIRTMKTHEKILGAREGWLGLDHPSVMGQLVRVYVPDGKGVCVEQPAGPRIVQPPPPKFPSTTDTPGRCTRTPIPEDKWSSSSATPC